VLRERRVASDVDATVPRMMPYGAFARVSSGIEGLIHVSDIASRHLATPTEVVPPGEVLRVRVVAIDPSRGVCRTRYVKPQQNVMYETRTASDANV